MLPCHARCVLSRLRCNGQSLLLGSYLSRIGRIENPSCSACGHPSQDPSHLILHYPATDSLCRSLFRYSLSLYDLRSRPWGVALLLGLYGLPPYPHPWEGVGQPTFVLIVREYYDVIEHNLSAQGKKTKKCLEGLKCLNKKVL